MTSKAVQHLRTDHDEIKKVLTAFEHYLEQSQTPQGPDRHELWELIECLTESLLLKHEEKEESLLLPALTRHGMDWSSGTLANVRKDHRQGRYLLRSLRQAAHQKEDWSIDDRLRFLAIGKEWVTFNRRHMALEEASLFLIASKNIRGEEDKRMAQAFDSIERDFYDMPDARRLSEGTENFLTKYGIE